jgi:hypothetical protein
MSLNKNKNYATAQKYNKNFRTRKDGHKLCDSQQ